MSATSDPLSATSTTKVIPGGRGRIRTFVARKERQIYSLLVLATHPPVREMLDTNSLLRFFAERVVVGSGVARKHKTDSCPKTPALSCYHAGIRSASLPCQNLVELAEGFEPPTL